MHITPDAHGNAPGYAPGSAQFKCAPAMCFTWCFIQVKHIAVSTIATAFPINSYWLAWRLWFNFFFSSGEVAWRVLALVIFFLLNMEFQVNKTYFHPRCMKCQVCDELQTSRYLTYKDLPICEEDYKVREWWSQSRSWKLWVVGMGWQNVWIKMRKVRGRLSSAGQSEVLAKKVMGSIFAEQVNLCKWQSLAFAQEWSLLVRGLFQVSHKPCICQSNRLRQSNPNFFLTASHLLP